jgi:hypothetical protein
MRSLRPRPAPQETAEESGLPIRTVLSLARLDPRALGLASGLVCGLWLWLGTVTLLLRGGERIGPTLSLLSQYLIGYSVTPIGSLLAFLYGALAGFLFGYLFAHLRNWMVRWTLFYLRRRAEREAAGDLLDRLT